MTRSSEVVMRLNGCDATDGMFDLVFSRPQGEQPTSNPCQCSSQSVQRDIYHMKRACKQTE